ncbi:MAG: ribonuclease P protein component [Candidatus Gracilibacteria bacterium]|nr:ribonuclease P protein component [Candidatus Gracilibacteria bacterium]
MLEKQHRNLSSEEIAELFKNPHTKSSNSTLRIHTITASEKMKSQFVVIVSRKVHKSAVKRNMIRRQLYSVLSRMFSQWTSGLRVAILVKPSFLKLSRTQRLKTFLDLLHDDGLI